MRSADPVQSADSVQSAAPAQAANPGQPANPQPANPGQPATPGPADAERGNSYSYPDDDWGPPLDEDAPPLDEEPPVDWEPPAPHEPRSVPSPADASRPARASVQASVPARPSGDSSSDPWSRAVEQAPGVWALGSETNVGKYMSRPDDHAGQEPPAPAAPRYDPATAQVPPSAHPTAPDPAATSRPAQVQAEEYAHSPSTVQPGAPEPDTAEFVPAYAMASAPATGSGAAAFTPGAAPSAQPHLAPTRVTALGTASAGAPAAAQGTAVQGTAAVAAPPAGNGKLSLYQRLSNSPEAEAGRAKAPTRQPESAASYVQDIPSADDETIEESGVFGRAAVERILGGKLIEERSLDGSPLLPRY